MNNSPGISFSNVQLDTFNNLSLIESLPNEILGKIIAYLPNVTGSVGALNDADIPVTMRYMQNLACTSKRMYSCVHDPYTTKLFIYALARKYKNVPEYYAAQLNTVAARVFLWDYIKENKFDEVYSVIQNIYSLASSVLQEAKVEGLVFEYLEGRKEWPSPRSMDFQTKSGFLLFCDAAPDYIATPFGKIKIYGCGVSEYPSPFSVSEVFIKRLDATFELITSGGFGPREGTFYEITNSSMDSDKIRKIDEDDWREIDEHDLEGKIGSQNLIVNTCYGNYSVYKIRQVSGRILPEPTHHVTRKSVRSYELINAIWKMLEQNRLENDPLRKGIFKN